MSTLTPSLELRYRQRERNVEALQEREQGCNFARILVVSALLVAPLALGAVETWSWAALSGAIGLAIIWWSMASARRDLIELVWCPVYIPVAIFLLLGVIQLATGKTVDSASTRNALVDLAACGGLFFLVTQLAPSLNRAGWRTWGLIVLAYSFCIAMYAIIQYFASPGQIYWRIVPHSESWIFGPYVNHNHYAGLMEMLIPVSAGYVLSRRRHQLTPLLVFAVLVPVSSVFLSGSRGGVLALLLESTMFVGLLLLVAPKDLQKPKTAGVTLALAIAFVGFLWMQPGGLVQRLETVLEPGHSSDVSFRDREQVGLDSLRMFRQHLWFGTGLGSFEYAYPQYQTVPGDAVWKHAHDDFVEMLAETGVAGGTLGLVAVVLWCCLAFQRLSDRLRHGIGWIQAGAAIGCCGLLLHSLVDFNLHIPANALWFAACAGLAMPTRNSFRALSK